MERPHVKVTGTGPDAILFLGGLGSDRYAWDLVIAELGSDFRAIRFDSRGVGQNTTQPNQPKMEGLIEDALAAVDNLAVDRFFLVGHSLGGYVAQEIARQNPLRVRGMCVLNSFTCLDMQTLMVLSRLRRLPPVRRQELASCIAALDTNILDAYLAVISRLTKYSQPQPPIAAPTMVLNALQDELYIRLPIEAAEVCFKNFRLFELDTGHDSINESPSRVAGFLRTFLLDNRNFDPRIAA